MLVKDATVQGPDALTSIGRKTSTPSSSVAVGEAIRTCKRSIRNELRGHLHCEYARSDRDWAY